MSNMNNTNHVHRRYLDPEDRFEIFTVKAAERPHLLLWIQDSNATLLDDIIDTDEKKLEDSPGDDARILPPLTDGCDLPGWRCEGIAPSMNHSLLKTALNVDVDSPFQGALNVGAGSTLFRRESVFPFISSNSTYHSFGDNNVRNNIANCWWHMAKKKLSNPPALDTAASVVRHEDVTTLVDRVGHNGRNQKVTLFSLEYEVKNRPVKILNATHGWDAMPDYQHEDSTPVGRFDTGWMDMSNFSMIFSGGGLGGWTFANLLSRFGDVAFRFSDQHGEMMSLNTYAKYIINPEGLSDDSPLGIYDSEFGDDAITRLLLSDYSVPSCFSPDLFELADSDQNSDAKNGTIETFNNSTPPNELDHTERLSRPPYRWILIGPERSGTGMHVDPLWTNAWVTLLQGLKRWLLFPPDTPYDLIGMTNEKPQIPSSIWFRDYYERVMSLSWPVPYQPVEVLQYPGETVFVPAGWPHLVLNLELSVAITHNYASEFGPFFKIWEDVANDEPDFASRWYMGLRRHGRQDLMIDAPLKIRQLFDSSSCD